VDYRERAETYLRLLAEAALRPGADGHAGRIRRAADLFIEAGVLTEPLAMRILADFQLSLRVRGRQEVFVPSGRLRRLSSFAPGAPGLPGLPGLPGGLAGGQPTPWRVLRPGQPTSGSRLMALILLDDKGLAPATLCFSPAVGTSESDVPVLTGLTATDNLGTAYRLGFTDGTWAGSTWTGTVVLMPAPPATVRKLDITGPTGPLLRADVGDVPADGAAPGAVRRPVQESPGERLLTRRAEAMLAELALGIHDKPALSQSGLAELAGTLEAAGLLSPLSPAPARLAALSQLLGLPLEGPAGEVPARWTGIMAHYGRRRRQAPVTGTAAIGMVLPEIEGVRLAVAGVRSGGAGSFLHAIVQGLAPLPRRRPPGTSLDTGFSVWARDDAGGWHLGAVEDVSPAGGAAGVLRLALLPPLCHETDSLAVEVAGTSQRVTAALAVRW
jgi:hypothetical protein